MTLLLQHPASAATVVFSDDFQDGNATGWTVQRGTWTVCQQPGRSLAYCVNPTAGAYPVTWAGSAAWSDYSVEAAVTVSTVNGGAGIIGRAQDRNHFYLLQLKQFRKLWGWVLHRRGDIGGGKIGWVDIAQGNYTWVANTTYNLKLDMQGSVLTASISTDGGATYTRLGGVIDSTYRAGQIGMRAWDTGQAYFDDVKVTRP